MAGIGSAGVPVKLPLGQSPDIKDPPLRAELQQVYNSIHILNGYLNAIRDELGGTDTGTPADNIKFRKKFSGIAAQAIKAGDIVSSSPSGIVKGIWRAGVTNKSSHPALRGPNGRKIWLINYWNWGIALGEAAVGATVEVGMGTGAFEVVGAKCGSIIWAADSRFITYADGAINDNATIRKVTNQNLTGNGKIYLSNNTFREVVGAVSADHEGLISAGYPYRSGDWYYNQVTFLYPIAIAVTDNFALTREFIKDPDYDTRT